MSGIVCQDRRCFSPTTGHLLDCNLWETLGLVVGRMENPMRLYKIILKTHISDMKKKHGAFIPKWFWKTPYPNVTYRGCFQITSVPNEGWSWESVDRCHTQVLICTWPGWFIGCLRDVTQSFESNSDGKKHWIIWIDTEASFDHISRTFRFYQVSKRLMQIWRHLHQIASQAFIIILILTTLGNNIIITIFVVIIIQKQT